LLEERFGSLVGDGTDVLGSHDQSGDRYAPCLFELCEVAKGDAPRESLAGLFGGHQKRPSELAGFSFVIASIVGLAAMHDEMADLVGHGVALTVTWVSGAKPDDGPLCHIWPRGHAMVVMDSWQLGAELDGQSNNDCASTFRGSNQVPDRA
jgi:hypothetical protein